MTLVMCISHSLAHQQGADAERAAEQVTTRMVSRLVEIIQRLEEPISYFRFVIDPNDFGQTVENIFHMAFVIKEGHAEIRLDNDGLPIIGVCVCVCVCVYGDVCECGWVGGCGWVYVCVVACATFGQTVESILIKEGRAEIRLDNDGPPFIGE